jgi:hypothetical protein
VDRVFTEARTHTGRELLEHLDGFTLSADNEDLDDPVLVTAEGRLIDTWREGYPYDERISRAEYEMQKRLLQIELLKMQDWVKAILFEASGPQVRSTRPRSGSRPEVFASRPRPEAPPG